ncbi:hypothetical protein ACKKBG_A28250 [Auxenochlorella protothecoides x Auxenochlorella symbiontica]
MASARGLTGMWVKDKANSDSMDTVCEMAALSWVLRTAVKIISRMELKDDEEAFEVTMKAGGILDVRERYPWSGEPVDHPRRDKRRGKHTAYVKRTDQGPTVYVKWDDPMGGTCSDHFRLTGYGDTLEQHSEMTIGERTHRYISRYNRQR